ncbi:MAG: hypothetical protein KKF93_06365 [Candidatus Omnitrophica bacterium]|nr:hypothetical protein [Candidatus Omnitrophota bacterium]
MYEAKQTFESKLNIFCDNFNNLITSMSALRKQNVELEVELQRERQRNQIFDKKEKTESK